MIAKAVSRFLGLSCFVWIIGLAPGARAQSNNQIAAEELFREGRKLVDQHKYREACEKFAVSQRLDPAVGTLLNLGLCYEKTGQTASAWATYREAVAAAKQSGQTQREKTARKAAAMLEPTLSRLTITVAPEARAEDVHVVRDGSAIPSDLWGTGVPVDPGDHVVSATAPDHKPWKSTVSVAPGATETVTVPELEALPRAPSDDAVASARTAEPVSNEPPPAPKDNATAQGGSFWNTQRIIAVISGAVGIAGGALSVVELIRFNDKKDQLNSICGATCEKAAFAQATAVRDEATSARTLAIVGGAVGGAGLVAGVLLWVTAPSASPPSNVTVGASVSPGGFMLGVHGSM